MVWGEVFKTVSVSVEPPTRVIAVRNWNRKVEIDIQKKIFFGIWNLEFGKWIGILVLGILDLWIFGSWILDLGWRNLESWNLIFGFWILDLGSWILVDGIWNLESWNFRIVEFSDLGSWNILKYLFDGIWNLEIQNLQFVFVSVVLQLWRLLFSLVSCQRRCLLAVVLSNALEVLFPSRLLVILSVGITMSSLLIEALTVTGGLRVLRITVIDRCRHRWFLPS